jgi:hypothetical protein
VIEITELRPSQSRLTKVADHRQVSSRSRELSL